VRYIYLAPNNQIHELRYVAKENSSGLMVFRLVIRRHAVLLSFALFDPFLFYVYFFIFLKVIGSYESYET
jgi:hypothetical protein